MSQESNTSSKTQHHQTMPADYGAEQGLLCSMLLDRDLLDTYGELPPEAFYSPANKIIYEALRELAASGKPAGDFIILTGHLRAHKRLDDCGGAAHITEVGTYVATPANHGHYAAIVREKLARRKLLLAAFDMAQKARDEATDVDAMMEEAEKKVFSLRADTEGKSDTVRHGKVAVLEAVDDIELAFKHVGGIVGISTGIAAWDRMTGGFREGEMIVIAARPSNGKTALGMQVAEHAARALGLPVLVFSLEMPMRHIMQRLILSRAGLNLQNARYGFVNKDERKNLIGRKDASAVLSAANAIGEAPIHYDDTPGLTSARFRSIARRKVREHGIKLIVLDYLQLMRGTSKAARENRQAEVAEISGTIKAVARELRIPVIALAQLNRDADENALPKLSHLRESGSIEQDADQVLIIHRLDRGKRRAKAEDEEQEQDHNTLLLLEKQRNGPVGPIKVRFVKEYTRFENANSEEKLFSNNPGQRQDAGRNEAFDE